MGEVLAGVFLQYTQGYCEQRFFFGYKYFIFVFFWPVSSQAAFARDWILINTQCSLVWSSIAVAQIINIR